MDAVWPCFVRAVAHLTGQRGREVTVDGDLEQEWGGSQRPEC